MNLSVLFPAMDKLGSLALVRQPVLKENFGFKPAKKLALYQSLSVVEGLNRFIPLLVYVLWQS